jgi:LmbE family N-acetylglucosaminyl deacetylase
VRRASAYGLADMTVIKRVMEGDTTIRSVDQLGTILSIWAHPDDEAYLAAGIMSLAVANGQRVVCVTATKGEAGSPDPERFSPTQMAAIREQELYACLDVLGVDEHRWLGFVDGTCDQVPLDKAVADLEAIIDEVEPSTIVTFGPDGFTGHPDHAAVSQWVAEAHRRSRQRGSQARLHQVVQTPRWIDDCAGPWRELGAFEPHLPPTVTPDELSIEIVLPTDVMDRKLRALAAQRSQTPEVRAALGDDLYRRSLDVERYRAPA